MSELTPEIAADVVAACQAGAEEAAGALSRALDGEFTLEVGEAGTYSTETPPAGFDGAGLLVKLVLGDAAAVVALPASAGMTPDWCAAPDATGESKLATLAQELGMLLLPETLMADDFGAGWSLNLAESLTAGGVADGVSSVSLTLVAGEERGELLLLWPATEPASLLAAASEEADEPANEDASETAPTPAPTPAPQPQRIVRDFKDLPSYARSLLNIEVPVMVTLAEKQEDLGSIVDLGPGSILTFDKPCNSPLGIEVEGRPIALGEAVKVGEKFGVRVTEMILPGEKFQTLSSQQKRGA